MLIMFLALVAISIFATWSYLKYDKAKKELTNYTNAEGEQEIIDAEVQELIAKVGQLMMLPDDEEPVVATLLDVEKLAKEQPFYQKAKNEDRLLIYSKNKKAIIYSPSKNIIVNVGTVHVNKEEVEEVQSTVSPTPEPEEIEEVEETDETPEDFIE